MRMIMLALATMSIVTVCASGMASPASAQGSPCDNASASQYQYCGTIDVTIVPPPEPPTPPDGASVSPDADVPGDVSSAGDTDVAMGEAALSPGAEAASSAPSAQGAQPASAVAQPGAARPSVLPETGGPGILPLVTCGMALAMAAGVRLVRR